MELVIGVVIAVVVGIGSFVAGYILQRNFTSAQIKAQSAEAQKQVAQAEARAKDIILKAKDESLKYHEEVESDLKKKRVDLQREDERLPGTRAGRPTAGAA